MLGGYFILPHPVYLCTCVYVFVLSGDKVSGAGSNITQMCSHIDCTIKGSLFDCESFLSERLCRILLQQFSPRPCVAFGALALSVGRRKLHPAACKNLPIPEGSSSEAFLETQPDPE